ncbi:unnamed protein product [Diamesa serratosioi]
MSDESKKGAHASGSSGHSKLGRQKPAPGKDAPTSSGMKRSRDDYDDRYRDKRPDTTCRTNKIPRVQHNKRSESQNETNTKMGSSGQAILCRGNYFNLMNRPQFTFTQYHLDFEPEIENARVRGGILNDQKPILGGFIYDRGSTVYLIKPLMDDMNVFNVKSNDGTEVKMKLKKTNVIDMCNDSSIQILNTILRRAMAKLDLQLVGRNLYDAVAKKKIDARIELWPGYITSIRQHERLILLCCEISHKVMRNETVLSILLDLMRSQPTTYQDAFAKIMIGATVLTDYNNKTYKIADVDFQKTPELTFSTKKGTEESFISYYLRRYKISIRNPKQPLIICKANAKAIRAGQSEIIALIPELCRCTGLTDAMKADNRQMKLLASETRIAPKDRFQRLMKFNSRLQNEKSLEVFKEFNFKLDDKLVEIPARRLSPEHIMFGGSGEYATQDGEWKSAIKNKKPYYATDLTKWCIIFPSKSKNGVMGFLNVLGRVAEGMHMVMKDPKMIEINDDRIATYVRALDDIINKDPRLVMVILERNNKPDLYAAIKKKCCVDRAVVSQVVTMTTINRPNLMSQVTNILIQMNVKLGGAPWMISLQLSGLMTIGFDVTHDARDRGTSWGAMVATMDLKDHVEFFSAVSQHKHGVELSNDLGLNVIKALKVWKEKYSVLPKKIILYRDGVGDGQIDHVKDHELNNILSKLKKVYDDVGQGEQLKFAFIVINKKINTRIFSSNNENPLPGTIVDDVITLPSRYDFFLISQSVRQGTVSPTSYYVIYDTLGINADKVQILTYKMCHLYFNWCGTTRVPAVVQYAKKLAFFVSQYLHHAPSNALEKQLYFL